MRHFNIARKAVAILANLSLLLNSFLPFVSAIKPAYAQSVEDLSPTPTPVEIVQESPTPTPEIIITETPTPTPEVIPEITPEPTPEATPTVEPTPEANPTVEPTVTPENNPSPEPQNNDNNQNNNPPAVNEVTPTVLPTITPTPVPVLNEIEQVCLTDSDVIRNSVELDWNYDATKDVYETREKVQLGVKYVFPQDNLVTVTFNCLPKEEFLLSTLKIKRVKTSDLKLPNIENVGDYAYDITTDMRDGIFKYDITLPKLSESTAKVSYIEKSLEEATLTPISANEVKSIENLEQQSDSVKATDVDHFTIFIVTSSGNTPTLSTAMVNGQTSVTVLPNTTISVTVNVTTSKDGNDNDSNDWESTGYKIGNNNWQCSNTDDHNSSGTNIESFNISAPAINGTYNLLLRAYNGPGCSGGVSSDYLMNNAIVVASPSPALTPPTLSNNPGDTYALNSVTGNWTSISGGSGYQGIGSGEIRWGTPADGIRKSGLRFTNSGAQSFNASNTFYLGMLTHMNWGTEFGTAANGATLQITLNFNRPSIPNPVFTYDFDIEETSNTSGSCRPYQVSSTPCDDKITFPTSYGTQVVTIGDIQYTLVIDGFVNAYPNGVAVPAFITEEQRENSAFLVGHLSSELIPAPAINIEKKTNNVDVTTSPGPELNVGDSVEWKYIVQNTGNVDLTNISVVDNKVGTISCPSTSLPASTIPSERVMICTATGTVISGQYTNTATVTGTPPTGANVTDSDSSWYKGIVQKGHLIVHKTTAPANDSTVFSINATSTTGGVITGGGNGTVTDALDKNYEVTAGTYSVTETVPAGWTLTNNTCSNIVIAAGGTQECTITNTKYGSLTIVEDSLPNDPQDFSYTANNGLNSFSLDDDSDNNLSNVKLFSNLLPGTYSVTQAIPTGWDLNSIVCTDGSANTNISLPAGENVTCTFTNTKRGSISGHKFNDADGNASTPNDRTPVSGWTIELKKDGSVISTTSTNQDGEYSFTNLVPGNYVLTESDKNGWYHISDLSINVVLNPGESLINKDFTNSQLASITVYENLDTDGDGNIDITHATDGIWNINSAGGYQTGNTVSNKLPGSYTISEQHRTGYYVTSLVCNNGINYIAVESQLISLSPNQALVCTFTNTKINPVFTIDKTADVSSVDKAGDVINYKIIITNSGNQTLTGVSVTDPLLLSNLDCDLSTNGIQRTGLTINVGSQLTCTGSYTVKQSDIDAGIKIHNIATADTDQTNSKDDSVDVDVTQSPALQVVKSSTTTSITHAGQIVDYKFEVKNTGNQTLTSITVTDAKCDSAPAYQSGDINSDSKLDLTETWVYSCNHTVTQSEIDAGGNLTNTVTADSVESESDTDTKDIPITQNPKFTIKKSANVSTIDKSGDIIKYTVVVANTGNQTLTGVSVSDPLITNLDCNQSVVGNQNNGLTLNINSSLTCVGSYTITQSDINNNGGGDGDIDNTATVDTNQTGPQSDSVTVIINGSITIIKDSQPNDSQDFKFTGNLGIFYLDDDSSPTLSNTKIFSKLSSGTYTVTEPSTQNWELVRIECVGGSDVNTNNRDAVIKLKNGENVVCTFVNVRDTGTIIVHKDVQNPDGNNITDTSTNFTVKLDNSNSQTITDNGTVTYSNIITGNHSIKEDNISSNYSIYGISTSVGRSGNTSGLNISLSKGQTIDVYITNRQKKAEIKVYKDVRNPNGSDVSDNHSFTIQLNGGSNRSLAENDDETYEVNPGNGYTISELDDINYDEKGCKLFNSNSPATNLTITSNQEIKVICTNWQKNATVTVVKNVKAADGTTEVADNYTFKTKLDGSTEKSFSENSSAVYSVAPGNHSITENNDSNYIYVGCTPDDNGGQSGAQFSVGSNESKTITCINKQKPSSITIVKKSHPDSSTDFEFTRSFGANFILEDDNNNSDGQPDFKKFDNLNGGSYNFNENIEPGWYLDDIVCTGATSYNPVVYHRALSVTITPGQNAICTFHNYKKGKIEGEKFYDKNGNNEDDSGEPDLKGWKIFIDENGNSKYDDNEKFDMTDDDGDYSFDNLMPGNYRICEEMQTGWYPTSPGGNCKTTSIHNDGGDVDEVNFANRQYGSIKVCKVIIDGGRNIVNGSEVPNSTFTIDWDRDLNDTIFSVGSTLTDKIFTSSVSNDAICTTYSNLPIDTYHYSQEVISGNTSVWEMAKYNDQYESSVNNINNFYTYNQNTDSNGEINLALDAGINRTLVILNQYKHGSITVTKFNDLNSNGIKDVGETNLPKWTINLSDQTSQNTNDSGQVVFDKLSPKTYILSEDIKENEGWKQTGIYCENDTQTECPDSDRDGFCDKDDNCPSVANPDQLDYDGDHIGNACEINAFNLIKSVMATTEIYSDSYNHKHITIAVGQDVNCFIGNERLAPITTITKSNNSNGVELSPGSSVEYSINVGFTDNSVNNLKVTDLLSNGFKYQSGSYKVYKTSGSITTDVTSLITEPEYHSPGVWDLTALGVLKPEDTVKLVYTADISTSQQAGKYADLAWSNANYSYDPSKTVLALAGDEGKVDNNFVGTQVVVGGSYQESVSAEVKQENHTSGQVLGASTELPGTGAATIWMIISGLLGLVGFGFLKFNKKTMLTILITLLSFGLIISPVKAIEDSSNISVRLEEPKTPSRIKEIELKYVALDIQGRGITVDCLKKGPLDSGFVQFSSETLSGLNGNASHCSLALAITDNGPYQFQTKAIAGGEEILSNIVSLDYNTAGPGTPNDYRKDKINNCDYKIHFKTADDGDKTVKVEVYRSDINSFIADNGSKIGDILVGSNQERDFTNSIPDCSKNYNFVIRAFDSAGNGSGVTGDKVYSTITDGDTTVTSTTTNSGAVPVSGTIIPKEGDTDQENLNPSSTEENGQVLGTKTIGKNFFSRHPIITVLIVILILGIIIYAFKKIRKGKKVSAKKTK